MKDYFRRKLDEIAKRNAKTADAAERQAHVQARRQKEDVERMSAHLEAVARPAMEACAQALDEHGIKARLRFEAGVPARAAELPPLAEIAIDRTEGRAFGLSYTADGANFVMRLTLASNQRRAILPPARLTESRLRQDLDALLEAALSLVDPARTKPPTRK